MAGNQAGLPTYPFPRLTACLLDEEVDVLWTATPVRHNAIDSAPLPLTVPRIGLVPLTHHLVDAKKIPAAEFAALPMLYNPAIPDEWMSVFYLGDIGPRSEARLVPRRQQRCWMSGSKQPAEGRSPSHRPCSALWHRSNSIPSL